MAPKCRPSYRRIRGLPLPITYCTENFEYSLQYKPRPDDVFFVAYSKCGSSWSQAILLNIYRKGEPVSDDYQQVHPDILFLEVVGREAVENKSKPRVFRTHFDFSIHPYSPHAKYIYMARNPKDCCVSFYHHTKNIPIYKFADGTLDEFFEVFMDGEVDYGDYFTHVLSWYEHRNDPNVLFLTYEDMKRDTHATVLKMAKFIGKEYGDVLEKDPVLLNNVVKYSSFEFLKDSANTYMTDLFRKRSEEEIERSAVPNGIKSMMRRLNQSDIPEKPLSRVNFLRKGAVGDWRSQLTLEQSKRIDQRFADVLGHTDLAEKWKKDMEYR